MTADQLHGIMMHSTAHTPPGCVLCRERLEGAKEEVGLSQEALLQEQQLTHQLQQQARCAT